MRILLLRHGESTWNAEGRWQGHADPPLSTRGEEQSRRAVPLLPPVEAVVSSDLMRAARTADLLATATGLGPVRVTPRLRERDVGEWSGLTRADIEARWPGALAERRFPAGFEPDASVVGRVRAELHALASTHEHSTLLVVTHGGVIRGLERQLGVDVLPVPNLGGRWFELRHGELLAHERVVLLD